MTYGRESGDAMADDCYTNGNAKIQGTEGDLKTALQTWWQQQKTSTASSMFQDAKHGRNMLGKIAKFHFKTTHMILHKSL